MNFIPSAYSMRKRLAEETDYEERKNKEIGHQLSRIMRAIEAGKNFACWIVPDEFDLELKQEFKGKGYTFRPIGMSGGVRQIGEYICW